MKKKSIFALIAMAISLIMLVNSASALGITPAITEVDFEPNAVHTLIIDVINAKEGRKVSVYAEGEFAQYATIDKTDFYNGARINVIIKLPAEMKNPGPNNFYIVAAEEPPQNVFISSAVAVKARITVNVPYPGKYIDANLNVPSGNVDDKIPVELKVINHGTETISVNPIIEIYDRSGNSREKMEFNPITLKTNEFDYFRRYLDTKGFKQGDYVAAAVIDYSGERKTINQTFKLGNLKIDILNFTKILEGGRINKFNIMVKNNWNNEVKGVYADVSLSKGNYTNSFRTPSADMKAWEEKELTGFVDAKEMTAGEYKMDINLNYAGQMTYYSGIVTVTEPKLFDKFIISGVIAIVVALLLGAGYFFLKKNKKPRQKR